MKFSTIFTVGTLLLSATAAPLSDEVRITDLTVREAEAINAININLQHYNQKRDEISIRELRKREESAVTGILELIKNTNLGPTIIKYIIDDPELSKEATSVIVQAIKLGYINLNALLKSLNDSGLAVSVIQNLINDCQFYAEIFKIVERFIANLPETIGSLIGLNAATVNNQINAVTNSKRDIFMQVDPQPLPIFKREANITLTQLFESLKDSGLANQVVDALVVDDNFYTWGADLISQLFSSGAITFGSLLEAIVQSGLVPSIIENFLSISTLESVIVNALAAAFGNCKSVTPTTTLPTTTAGSPTPSVPVITATTAPSVSVSGVTVTTGSPTIATSIPVHTGSNCKRRKRSY